MVFDLPKGIHWGFLLIFCLFFQSLGFRKLVHASLQKRRNTSFSKKEKEKLQFYTTVWQCIHRRGRRIFSGRSTRSHGGDRENSWTCFSTQVFFIIYSIVWRSILMLKLPCNSSKITIDSMSSLLHSTRMWKLHQYLVRKRIW